MRELENNMDELLRKAAENYGLKPGASNWDTLSKAIRYEPVQAFAKKKNNYTGRYIATLLLLLLFLFTFSTLNKNNTAVINTEVTLSRPKVQQGTDDIKEKTITNTVSIPQLTNAVTGKYMTADIEQKSSHKKQSIKIKEKLNETPGINSNLGITAKSFSVTEQNNDQRNSSAPIAKSNNENSNEKDLTITKKATIASTVTESNTNEASINPKENIIRKQKGFYAGLLAGASFGSVKYQGIRKPGFDIGLLAGYKFSNKASLEAGLLFAKKNYYSDGKYFSMKKVGATMPQGMQVLSLEGSSQLLEIPLRVKYDLVQKKKSGVYAVAGISSYILLKEKNNYLTLLNGDKQNITSIYSSSSGYFAGSIDLSAGYEFKNGSKTNLRIEPYIQIPLKGTGVGALPVTSTGLRLVFTIPSR